jgi:hypothetical protein
MNKDEIIIDGVKYVRADLVERTKISDNICKCDPGDNLGFSPDHLPDSLSGNGSWSGFGHSYNYGNELGFGYGNGHRYGLGTSLGAGSLYCIWDL